MNPNRAALQDAIRRFEGVLRALLEGDMYPQPPAVPDFRESIASSPGRNGLLKLVAANGGFHGFDTDTGAVIAALDLFTTAMQAANVKCAHADDVTRMPKRGTPI